jgi:large subunit ribosomal protein L4
VSVKIAVLNNNGKAGEPMTGAKDVFGKIFNEALVHEVVVGLMANSRSDTSMQKNRSACRGGGRKPWQQKGLGRARAGSIRSPLWRGGGATFGGQQANHAKKINKKAYREAMRSILSELVRQDRLMVVPSFDLKEAKTKVLKDMLGIMKLDNVLIALDQFDEALYLASRNIPYVDVVTVDDIYPVSLLAYDKVIISEGAKKHLEEWLS